MKKSVLRISLMTIILQLYSIISFASSNPTLYINDVTKYPNQDKVTVGIFMKNTNSNIVTLGVNLEYDSSKLEYIDSEAGKDLSATIKLAENIPEESKVAIGIVSIGGLKKDGIYYEIDFKVKDEKENIPLKLRIKEATDSKGNEIKINTKDGMIHFSKDETKIENVETENKDIENNKHQINNFEKTELEELENIETLIIENSDIEVLNNTNFSYETNDTSIIEILDDGTMIPNKDGKAIVNVKVNNQEIADVEVEVKDGKITKISGNKSKNDSTSESINTKNKNNEKQHLSEKEEKNGYVVIVMLVITILSIIFYFIKKKRGGNK